MANVKAAIIIALLGFSAAALFVDYFMLEPKESLKLSSIITQVGIIAFIVACTMIGMTVALKKKKKS